MKNTEMKLRKLVELMVDDETTGGTPAADIVFRLLYILDPSDLVEMGYSNQLLDALDEYCDDMSDELREEIEEALKEE